MVIVDLFILDVIDVDVDGFRIRSHYRAIIVIICPLVFPGIIRNARIENSVNLAFYKVLDVAMYQLCWIANALRRDGFHTQLIDFSRGTCR